MHVLAEGALSQRRRERGASILQEWRDLYGRDRDAEEKVLDRFRDQADPLQLLIVTAKLLTGFDAPILQVQYLDKPLRDHTLLQAICRTNRTYPSKTHGLIVDYLGIFDDVAQAFVFDDASIQKVVTNINELKDQLPPALAESHESNPCARCGASHCPTGRPRTPPTPASGRPRNVQHPLRPGQRPEHSPRHGGRRQPPSRQEPCRPAPHSGKGRSPAANHPEGCPAAHHERPSVTSRDGDLL